MLNQESHVFKVADAVQARNRLVEAFKVLRAGDSVPGSGTVYRITVRQLEALIRLSEALARVHHRTSVLEEDVREAQRLIKASVHSAGDGDMVMDIPEANERAEDIAHLFLDDAAPADTVMQDQDGVSALRHVEVTAMRVAHVYMQCDL